MCIAWFETFDGLLEDINHHIDGLTKIKAEISRIRGHFADDGDNF